MDTDKTMVAMMDFGSTNGLALISSQTVVSEGRICVHLWLNGFCGIPTRTCSIGNAVLFMGTILAEVAE